MPFLRPGHDGTFASPTSSALKAPLKSRGVFGLLTLFSLSAASVASPKPFKAVGVKAWTSGSQTYIRVRPSADVPPVAKVKRHTPLYVWGKFNGWYRVETHDHIFGWVHNQYIETPKAEKIRAMPQSKARLASDRTAKQTVYGTPQELKRYYATYVAPQKAKESKIRLASTLKSTKNEAKVATKPRFAAAKQISKPVLKPAVAKTTSRLRLANAPRVISPVPRVENGGSAKSVAKPIVRIVSTKNQTPRSIAPVLSGKMGGYAAPRVAALKAPPVARVAAPVVVVAPVVQVRDVESGKIASSSRALTPSAKLFARAASEAASKSESSASTQNGEPLTNSKFEPVPLTTRAAVIVPVTPRPKVRVAPVKRVVKTRAKKKSVARKPVTRATSRNRYTSRKERQREQLRARMGMVSATPHSVIAPVSPAELMKARQEYLTGRKERLGLPASPATDSTVTEIAPLPAPNGPLGGPASTGLSPLAPAQFAPMSFEPSHPLAPLLGNPYVVALAQLKSKPAVATSRALVAVNGVAPLPVAPLATRGGSPRDRALSRGGSPRDRFGSGMANQALSYRGMRYIRGAASPSRGFDCSGLIYFLLKQRGYNPPRTAAGYRSWGQNVPKGQLKSGDLVLFANTYKRGISHIGVYMGEGKFVHAATSSTGVRVSSLNERYYAGKYFGARRAKAK